MKALTFNVAGLPIIHGNVGARLRAAAAILRASDYDVAAFQELWFERHSAAFVKAAGWPHAARFNHGWLGGGGLLTLSRHPIAKIESHPFKTQIFNFRLDGEAISTKGLLLTRLVLPAGELDVYNTHLTSFYEHDRYEHARVGQIDELCAFVKSRSAGRPVLIMGDLNMEASEAPYRTLIGTLGLFDPGHPEAATTFRGRRIDYALLPAAAAGAARSKLAFTETFEKGPRMLRYSDHHAVEVEFGPELHPLRVC